MASKTPTPIQAVSNIELYNQWAKVYDTDGNMLQSIDDLLLPTLLTTAFSLLPQTKPSANPSATLTITELGCGTGRNTAKLLLNPPPKNPITHIHAVDLSPAMLAVASQRCDSILASLNPGNDNGPNPRLNFHEFDALNPSLSPAVEKLYNQADLVLSTLVLEHLPLTTFFTTLKNLLNTSGIAVITNMHSEMGSISRAGFLDPETGTKIQGDSFVYTVDEMVEAARKEGFVVVGEVVERAVCEEDVGGGVVGLRGRKWIGVRVWFGFVLKLVGDGGGEGRGV